MALIWMSGLSAWVSGFLLSAFLARECAAVVRPAGQGEIVGNLSVRFVSFTNRRHLISTGEGCDLGWFGSKECDPRLTVCFMKTETAWNSNDTNAVHQCDFAGPFYCGPYDNAGNIEFGTTMCGNANPMVFNITKAWLGAEMRVRVDEMERGSFLGSNTAVGPLIDRFSYFFNARPADDNVMKLQLLGFTKANTSLVFEAQIRCHANYYDVKCSTFCVPSTRYTCDTKTGQMVCKTGWTGDACTARSVSDQLTIHPLSFGTQVDEMIVYEVQPQAETGINVTSTISSGLAGDFEVTVAAVALESTTNSSISTTNSTIQDTTDATVHVDLTDNDNHPHFDKLSGGEVGNETSTETRKSTDPAPVTSSGVATTVRPTTGLASIWPLTVSLVVGGISVYATTSAQSAENTTKLPTPSDLPNTTTVEVTTQSSTTETIVTSSPLVTTAVEVDRNTTDMTTTATVVIVKDVFSTAAAEKVTTEVSVVTEELSVNSTVKSENVSGQTTSLSVDLFIPWTDSKRVEQNQSIATTVADQISQQNVVVAVEEAKTTITPSSATTIAATTASGFSSTAAVLNTSDEIETTPAMMTSTKIFSFSTTTDIPVTSEEVGTTPAVLTRTRISGLINLLTAATTTVASAETTSDQTLVTNKLTDMPSSATSPLNSDSTSATSSSSLPDNMTVMYPATEVSLEIAGLEVSTRTTVGSVSETAVTQAWTDLVVGYEDEILSDRTTPTSVPSNTTTEKTLFLTENLTLVNVTKDVSRTSTVVVETSTDSQTTTVTRTVTAANANNTILTFTTASEFASDTNTTVKPNETGVDSIVGVGNISEFGPKTPFRAFSLGSGMRFSQPLIFDLGFLEQLNASVYDATDALLRKENTTWGNRTLDGLLKTAVEFKNTPINYTHPYHEEDPHITLYASQDGKPVLSDFEFGIVFEQAISNIRQNATVTATTYSYPTSDMAGSVSHHPVMVFLIALMSVAIVVMIGIIMVLMRKPSARRRCQRTSATGPFTDQEQHDLASSLDSFSTNNSAYENFAFSEPRLHFLSDDEIVSLEPTSVARTAQERLFARRSAAHSIQSPAVVHRLPAAVDRTTTTFVKPAGSTI